MSELSDIMALDPLDLTDPNVDLVIEDMRGKRHRFNLGDTKAGVVKPKAAPKALAGVEAGDLQDLLGGDLKI